LVGEAVKQHGRMIHVAQVHLAQHLLEIPLYHYTPATFGIAMDRGIPQQMLSEMDLRDMNHPSVLFHGLANESTGGTEREQALASLYNLDRAIDGTRLTGQAAYGNQPDDQTSRPLDVA